MNSSYTAPSWPWLQKNLAPTSWSLVRRSTRVESPDAGKAAELICRIYWYPLYTCLRNKGYSKDDAQDYVQSFLAKLIQGGILKKADPARGRLRTYLMTLVQRHAATSRRASSTLKRGGGVAHIPVDWNEAEISAEQAGLLTSEPENAFRQSLAMRLVEESIAMLEAEFNKAGRERIFEALLPSLEGVMEDHTFEDLARELGMTSGALRVASFRLRERFRKSLRVTAATALGMTAGPELDAEMRLIFG